LLFALLAAPAAAHRPRATPTPSPTPVPPADPAVTSLARRAFVLAQAGQLDKRIMTPEFQANSTDQELDTNSEQLGTLGALTGMEYLGPVDVEGLPAGAHAYLYKMLCANGSIYEQIFVDQHGKIAGEQFRDTLATPTPAPTDTPEAPLEDATP
jgi:hypothetical protein